MMILRLALVITLMVSPVLSWAAVTYVSHTESAASINVSSITTSLTVAVGTDRAAYFCSQIRSTTPGRTVSSVVFNGSEAFTFIRGDNRTTNDTDIMRVELWRAVGLTETTANIVATYSGSVTRGVAYSVTQFEGVNQSEPVDSHAGSSGSSTTPSVTITTVADNAAILDCFYGRPGGSGLTVGAGQTMRTDRLLGGSFADGAGASTVVTKTPVGDEVMNWTQPSESDNSWVGNAVSIPPSGGSDPPPVIPSQVSLSATLGTDPGTPSSGIASITFTRCSGGGCNATIAPAICTRAYPLNTCVDTAVSPGSTYGYSAYMTDGVGLTSTRHATVYVTTSGTPPAAPPSIASAVFDNTGVTITAGAVTPTTVKIWTYTDLAVVSSVEYTWASLTAGRHDETWVDGLQGACVSAIDADGIENLVSTDYQCTNLFAAGIVEALDTTPPVLTCATPIELPAGVTSWTFSCDIDKPNTGAKYENGSDTTYTLMSNTMSANALTFSAAVSGLLDDSTTILYVRGTTFHPFAVDENEEPVNYPNTTSQVVVIHVAAAAGDVTPPGDVAGLDSTLLGTSVSFTWTHPATDAVNYQLYQSSGACSTYEPAGQTTAPPITIASLTFDTVYCWKIKALDVVGNLSTNFSSVVTETTPPAQDTEPPSQLQGLKVETFQNTVRLSWGQGSDNNGIVYGNMEFCRVESGQTDCANFTALSSPALNNFIPPQVLATNTMYCFRGKFSDPAGNISVEYSDTVCTSTTVAGTINAPRLEATSSTRQSSERLSSGTRLPKP